MCIRDRQQTAAFPRAIVVVDAGPRWQILWYIAPLATRFVDVKNPVEDFPVRVLSGSAKGRGFGETVGNEVPFGRGEIGCISHPNVNRGKRILVQLQNARFIIVQPKMSLFKQALSQPAQSPCAWTGSSPPARGRRRFSPGQRFRRHSPLALPNTSASGLRAILSSRTPVGRDSTSTPSTGVAISAAGAQPFPQKPTGRP